MTTVAQHVDTRAQRIWIECCEREKKLRLKWFIVNQQNIQKLSQSVPRNEKNIALQNEVNAKRVDIYRNAAANRRIRKPKPNIDIINYEVDENVMLNPMKPVDPELQDIFYEANAQNRKLYLKLRSHIMPEDRYYFRETTGFHYGWKMRHHAKESLSSKKFGKIQIIRQSFYRRSGIGGDPEYYREPAQFSPTICSK
ncbi:protein ATP6V1FNB-like [Chrysoperla carnea]|uniref:protein ATP6V1FNB-like n=1 Tax=Chrysoperla carnea TaxID=189513 RepID=UPI001D05D340|nr:protein ATP6V1FNB-like [Chrysoperla carnea]